MGRSNLLTVGIAVRRTAKIEPHEGHHLPPPVLQLDFGQVDAAAAHVE
jgi:hypothetical protein